MIGAGNAEAGRPPGSTGRGRFVYRYERLAESPSVSVITPFHNADETFRETVRCILGQSFQAFQWIIVNDATTDPESLALLDEVRALDDPRIKIIDLEQNVGPGAARNVAFRCARTELVLQIDADDLLEPTAMEKLAWYMQARPEMAFTKGLTVGFDAQKYMWKGGFHEGRKFLARNYVNTSGTMVRRSVHEEMGGYDESIRDGAEDWEFWLRCADAGHWGDSLFEYLDWYRRRENDGSTWPTLANEESMARFRDELLVPRFPNLYRGDFPELERRWPQPFDDLKPEPAFSNPLARSRRRVLMVVPWMMLGGADKFNLRLAEHLTARGWEVTFATTKEGDHSQFARFARITPDVFALSKFLMPADYPSFLRYLIESRRPEVVLLTSSELGYWILPYLRKFCPEPAYVDYCHIEEDYWKNGGYPRYAAWSQDLLELNVVSSNHLKNWMVDRGADPDRIEVCTTNEDTRQWRPRPRARRRVRDNLNIPEDRVVLLYAGRLVPQKKPPVFIEVVRRLHEDGLDFTAIVAGDGPWKDHIAHVTNQYGLWEAVRILGARPNVEMPGLMAASDILFLPSKWEGISLALYEAMAVGLVCVGAAVGGQRELVTRDCGILIPDADDAVQVELYTAELTGLIGDPRRIERMGRASRRRIKQNYRLCDMGERMIQLFERAISEHRPDAAASIPDRFVVECAGRGVEYLRTFDLAEQLWHERDQLRLALNSAQHAPPVPAPELHVRVRQMIEQNIRYRIADRVNDALKTVGLQRPLKAIMGRALRERRSLPSPTNRQSPNGRVMR